MSEEQQEPRKRRKRGGWDEPPKDIDPNLLASISAATANVVSAPLTVPAPVVGPTPAPAKGKIRNATNFDVCVLLYYLLRLANKIVDQALQATIAARIAAATSSNGVDSAYSMSCRIYVGSLYYDLTASDVSALFESFGDIVKCEMTMDAVTGKSKGFCFIEFRTPEMALAATAMNGFDLAGRKVCYVFELVYVIIMCYTD